MRTEPERLAVPAWAVLLPGGIQLHRDQEWFGAISMGLVVSLGGTSTAMYLALRGYDTDLQRPGIQVTSPADQARAEQLLFWTNMTRWSTATIYTASLLHGLFTSTNATTTPRMALSPNAIRLQWDWP